MVFVTATQERCCSNDKAQSESFTAVGWNGYKNRLAHPKQNNASGKLNPRYNTLMECVCLIDEFLNLQDVIAHGKNLETLARDKSVQRSRKNSTSETVAQKGLKSLTKEGRKMLEGYQHLFYALQTNPMYLSKLIFLLPQSKTNKFLQNVILTLFNFGSNRREEYLLLKLFGKALQEEIR